MKKFFILLGLALILIILHSETTVHLGSNKLNHKTAPTQDYSRATPKKIALTAKVDFGRIPLYFIPNRGQVDPKALFYAKVQDYTLWLTKDELIFDHSVMEYKEKPISRIQPKKDPEKNCLKRNVSRLHFVDCNTDIEVVPIKMSEYRVNYFKGKNPGNWVKNIPTSQAVLYKNLYDRIDLEVYGNGIRLEYDWIVRPGGDPESIKFEYRGPVKTEIKKTGNLFVRCNDSEFVHKKSHGYQIIHGKKHEVEVIFKSVKKNVYGFKLGTYTHSFPLIIDPLVLVFSNIIGGAESDGCRDIAVDTEGAVYITGWTHSTDFPITPLAYKTIFNGFRTNAFVMKLSPDGSSLEYSTYLGGNEVDDAYGIAVDGSGSAYITGFTSSPDFPITPGTFDETYNKGFDAFITKLNPFGSDLVYSTFLGAGAGEFGSGIAVDKRGAVYVTGDTQSPNFPVIPGSFDTTYNGNRDVFVTKMDPSGKNLEYSSFLGAGSADYMGQIEVDDKGSVYVAGWTYSRHFPTTPLAVDPVHNGGMDVFITKINSTGSALEYSTYLGGSGDERFYALTLDSMGAIYVTGFTRSGDFPIIPGAYDATLDGSRDIFITKLNPIGSGLLYSTFLGGSLTETAYGLASDENGFLHITGYTISQDFPVTEDAFDRTFNKDGDAFLTIFKPQGNNLLHSTFLGGSQLDSGRAIAVWNDSAIYLGGCTRSSDFPTLQTLEITKNEGTGIFVAKFEFSDDTTPPQISIETPKEGEVVSRSVSVEVFASDENEILKVEFYIDNKLKFIDSSEPYVFSWETLHYKNGPHKISAIASDLTGNSSSDAIEVIVHDLKTRPWWDVPRRPEQRRLPVLLVFPSFFL